MKKILLITYYWPPSGGAGVQRPLKFAKYLSLSGNEVHVLTVDPSKASYPVIDNSLAKEIPDNIIVHTSTSFEPLNFLGLFVSKKKIPYGGFANTKKSLFQNALRFIRGNFFIPDARVGWVNPAYKKAKEIIRKFNITDVLISSPPHSSQLIGVRLKKTFTGVHWIADLRDPWTDIYYYKELMHVFPATSLDRRLERNVIEKCDAALVVSPSIKKVFFEKSKIIPAEKIHVIPNGFDESDFPKASNTKENAEFTIAYIGTMADSYAPGVVWSCLKQILSENKELKVRLKFVGSISDTVITEINNNGLAGIVQSIPYIPHDQAIVEMRSADLLLLIIPDVDGAEGILTGKLFEYIGAKRPILGIGPPAGDAAAILKDTQSGKMFSRNEKTEIVNYLSQQVENWKMKKPFSADDVAVQKYTRRKQTEQVTSIFSNLQSS